MPEPIKKVISEKATMVYGFPDGHLDLVIKIPLIGDVKFRIDEQEISLALGALREAGDWNSRREHGGTVR